MDETSLSHSEIFGSEINYSKTVKESRGNKILDLLFGKKEREVQKVTRGPGMRAQTLQTYIDLMQEHGERRERQREKQKMKSKKKTKM